MTWTKQSSDGTAGGEKRAEFGRNPVARFLPVRLQSSQLSDVAMNDERGWLELLRKCLNSLKICSARTRTNFPAHALAIQASLLQCVQRPLPGFRTAPDFSQPRRAPPSKILRRIKTTAAE
jgi:hypothetical protein